MGDEDAEEVGVDLKSIAKYILCAREENPAGCVVSYALMCLRRLTSVVPVPRI